MFWNYLKIAFRNLIKQKFRSLINILGLGFGVACCILIYMYDKMEYSYNNFHKNKQHIYRVCYSYTEANGNKSFSPFQPYDLARGFKEKIPGVLQSCGLRSTKAWIGDKEELFNEEVGFTDSSFLDMFTFPILAGNHVNPLKDPQSVVLTRSVVNKIFGYSIENLDSIIGKSILFPQPAPNDFIITAILEDPPENNSFRWTLLIPYANAMYYPQCNNAFGNTSVYILLDPKTDVREAEKTSQSLIETYHRERINQLVHYGFLADVENNFNYFLQPMEKLYLYSADYSSCYEKSGNLHVLYILSSIAVLILLIACFNYVMLTIASTMNRMKDLGMMNVVGAQKVQIFQHFISESFILTVISIFIGILLADQMLPVFNRLADKHLTFTLFNEWENYVFLIIILLFIVFSTSLYVGIFILRKDQPLKFLRKEILTLKHHNFTRYFIIFQYLITIILLICTGVIIKQLHYMLQEDVGFNKENIIVLQVDFNYQKVLTLKDKLLQYSHIVAVSMSDRDFMSGRSSDDIKNKKGELVETRFLRIDPDYLKTFGIELIDGRNFTANEPIQDNYNVIVNEAFVRAFELETPVGEIIPVQPDEINATIIGVVHDFHFDSMHDEIMPVMLIVFPFNSIWAVFVRIDGKDIPAALDQIKNAWNEVVPEYTLDYSFLSDNLDKQYSNEGRWSKVTAIAAVIAIFLSCLGLLGISGLLVARRTKEVGLRKANGASVFQIITLLNTDILKWVIVSFIIACPAAWFIMNRWLRDFAYRTPISWWIFVLAGLSTLVITLLTISWQSWKAARQNPVDTLRYE
jgi:putative ABC transport system permease protein